MVLRLMAGLRAAQLRAATGGGLRAWELADLVAAGAAKEAFSSQ